MSVRPGLDGARSGRASQPHPGIGRAGSTPERRLRLLDVHRMIEKPPPPVAWRIKGLAVDGCLTMLAGREGQGKSLLALTLASAVSRGGDVAGFTCQQGRSLIVDVENGEHEAHRRIHGLRPDPDGLSYCVDPLKLPDELDLLDYLIAEVQPNFLVLDSLRPMSGGSDENDSRMDTVLAPLRDLVRASGAACVLLHHAPKQGDEYRGSTAIGAAVELGFTLASPGEGDAKRLRCWKCRPAAKQPDRWLAIRERPNGPEFVRADAPTPADTGMADLTDKIVAALASGPQQRADLAELVGEPRTQPSGAFQRALNVAVSRALVAKLKRGLYALPQETP
jgi:hypothetical protein